jgi:hypothetical protein
MVKVATQQAQTTTAGDDISIPLGSYLTLVDILVDTSGSATLSIDVSNTGEFSGEETTVQTVDYSSGVNQLEQFEFAYPFVQVSVDSNLNELEIVSRGE